MKSWIKVLLITLLVGIPAFIAAPFIWPSSGLGELDGQLPFLILISAFEALTFGLGIALIFIGWPYVKNKTPAKFKKEIYVMFWTITYLILSWWPHDNFHIANGNDMWGLVAIEYGFHVPGIVAALLLAYNLLRLVEKTK